MDRTQSYLPETAWTYEPLLPPGQFFPKAEQLYPALQQRYVKLWQKHIQDAPPLEERFGAGAHDQDTETEIRPVISHILGKSQPTQRDVSLATSMVNWLATGPGQAFITSGTILQHLFLTKLETFARPRFPHPDTAAGKEAHDLYGWYPDAFFMEWSRKKHVPAFWPLGMTHETARNHVNATLEQYLALEPKHFDADGKIKWVPDVSQRDSSVFDAVTKWLGTREKEKKLGHMVSGEFFIAACMKENLKAFKPGPSAWPAAPQGGPAGGP